MPNYRSLSVAECRLTLPGASDMDGLLVRHCDRGTETSFSMLSLLESHGSLQLTLSKGGKTRKEGWLGLPEAIQRLACLPAPGVFPRDRGIPPLLNMGSP